jgi:hypothetical protein
MPEIRPFRAFHLSSPTRHVDSPAMVPTTPSYTSLAPCTIRASQNDTKQQGSGRSQLYKELQEDIKSLQDLVERAVKEFEEHRADIASRSVTIVAVKYHDSTTIQVGDSAAIQVRFTALNRW